MCFVLKLIFFVVSRAVGRLHSDVIFWSARGPLRRITSLVAIMTCDTSLDLHLRILESSKL